MSTLCHVVTICASQQWYPGTGLHACMPCTSTTAVTTTECAPPLFPSRTGAEAQCPALVCRPLAAPVRVLYSTTLDKSLRASLTKTIRRLGGSVEDQEGPHFTHFLTLQPTAAGQTDRGFKKSINALIALAAGEQAANPLPNPFA